MLKVVSGFLVHMILVAVMILMYLIYGFPVNIYYVQTVYYLVYTILLLTGFVYLTCTLYVFFKDIIQIVGILLQVIFWTTPIVWQLDIMSESVQNIIRLSPLFYIVRGYRDCYVNRIWFWEYGSINLYYWLAVVGVLALGIHTFEKCKRHFADVL